MVLTSTPKNDLRCDTMQTYIFMLGGAPRAHEVLSESGLEARATLTPALVLSHASVLAVWSVQELFDFTISFPKH